MNIKETEYGAIVEVFVKPNAQRFGVTIDDNEIVVSCREHPNKGKVNKELLKEFSKLFHGKVELVSGLTSKQKRILLKGITKKEAEKLLRDSHDRWR